MTHHSVLDEVVEQIRKLRQIEQKVLVVFDLDSTLFDVTGRNQLIVREFANDPTMQARYPLECSIAAKAEFRNTDWGIRSPLVRAGMQVTSQQFFHDMREFWKERFFSNEYLKADVAYEGAADYVHELMREGAHIMYLTGRDEIRMGLGTRQILRRWNFPVEEDGCKMVLKPHQGIEDAEFKRDIFLELGDDYHSVWFFENEPVNIHLVAKHCPHIQIVYFDSVHAGQAEPPTQFPVIRSYQRKSS